MPDMPTKSLIALGVMVVTAALAFVVACNVYMIEDTRQSTADTIRNEAIEAGVGYFSCDPTTGESTFEWIKPENENESTND